MPMSPKELLSDVKSEYTSRKFSTGLFMAMIDLFMELDVPSLKAKSFADVLKKYPRQDHLANGARANTLVLDVGGKFISLRPFYNRVEKVIRADNKRFG